MWLTLKKKKFQNTSLNFVHAEIVGELFRVNMADTRKLYKSRLVNIMRRWKGEMKIK